MQIGYARSSTIDQEAGYQAQIKTLTAAGCDKIFAEKVSSVAQRAELDAALEYAREGDALVVTKLDRLARSVAHLVAIGEKLDAKGVSLKVLEQAIDTSTPTGRLMFNMLGAIAQFERELMLERQREGVAKAKLEGKYSVYERGEASASDLPGRRRGYLFLERIKLPKVEYPARSLAVPAPSVPQDAEARLLLPGLPGFFF